MAYKSFVDEYVKLCVINEIKHLLQADNENTILTTGDCNFYFAIRTFP